MYNTEPSDEHPVDRLSRIERLAREGIDAACADLNLAMTTERLPPEVQTMRSTLNIACHGCGCSIRKGHTFLRLDTRGPAWHLTCYLTDLAVGLMRSVTR